MAYLTVTTQLDVVDPGDGQLSLREAVAQANATSTADTIRFVAALEGRTLVLTGGELPVTQDLTIDGDRYDDGTIVTIDGNLHDRLLNISGADTGVTLQNVALINGQTAYSASESGSGGAILLNAGSLLLDGSTVAYSNTSNYGSGGGIFAAEYTRLSIVNSSIINNTASSYSGGGGIATGENAILTIRNSIFSGNDCGYSSRGGAIEVGPLSFLDMDASIATGNSARGYGRGGAIFMRFNASAVISRSSFFNNSASEGGAIWTYDSNLLLTDSTVANNTVDVAGGGVSSLSKSSTTHVRNSTITGNSSQKGGGLSILDQLIIDNSIISGNKASSVANSPDLFGVITTSNGHNVFGTDVLGNAPGDRENVGAISIFATIDPLTGGGQLSPTGIVPLKNSVANPALSAANPITASSFGQLGTTLRPLPAGSVPDIGSIEINQPLSTSPTVYNDVITGSGAANNLSGLAGNDLIQGLAGADTLNGNDGSDVLDGGPGNDKLNGGTGMDIATFAGTTAVVVDLSAKPATAKRGGETDTLTSVEGIIGSSKADTFKGDGQNNEFQGGLGKDTATGGAGRDLYAFKSVQDSPAGSGRDVIKDFAPGQDVIDVSNIDADSTAPGQHSFRWVGKATLTGAAQLGYYVSGGNTIIRASNDADAAAEVEIQLTGVKTLTEGDFRF